MTTTEKPVRPTYPVPDERVLDLNPVNWAKSIWWHFSHGTINWPMSIYLTLCHLWALSGLLRVPQCMPETLIFAFLLWPFSGLGITAGVHRLWSHRSYKAGRVVRGFLMLMNSIANQGSIWHWARDHRVHHKHSETDADPHNATRGFFFAHMGWLFVKKHPDVVFEGKKLDFSDLEADGFVVFQRRFDPWFAFFMCFFAPAIFGRWAWGETFWNGFFVAGSLRYIIVLHFTWLVRDCHLFASFELYAQVNSAAHFFGDHPYDEHSWPSENPFVSLASIGEGWHNWHHKYPYDYAASEFGITSQFNPTKLFIDGCAALGLVTDRKRAISAWERTKAKRNEAAANKQD